MTHWDNIKHNNICIIWVPEGEESKLGFLFIVITEFFTEEKSSYCNKVQLTIFSLTNSFICVVFKTHHKTHCHVYFIVFFSRSIIVFNFTFSSMIYFDLVFVKGVRSMSKSHFPLNWFCLFVKDQFILLV